MRCVAVVVLCLCSYALADYVNVAGTWSFGGSCAQKITVDPIVLIRQCGSAVVLGPADASGTLSGDPTNATMSSNGTISHVKYLGLYCDAQASAGSLVGTCYSDGGSPLCGIDLKCTSGACMSGSAPPTPGADGFLDISGVWQDTAGTCSQVPGFSSSFAITQCGGSVQVVPSNSEQRPNAGSLTAGGQLVVGTLPGSTTVCSGQISPDSKTFNGTCTYNGNPFCTLDLSHA